MKKTICDRCGKSPAPVEFTWGGKEFDVCPGCVHPIKSFLMGEDLKDVPDAQESKIPGNLVRDQVEG